MSTMGIRRRCDYCGFESVNWLDAWHHFVFNHPDKTHVKTTDSETLPEYGKRNKEKLKR
jgi:hypothetical protein